METNGDDMWHWLFDCLASSENTYIPYSLAFLLNSAAGVFYQSYLRTRSARPWATLSPRVALAPTMWPSVQSLTTFPQDSRLHPPQTHNVMLCWIKCIVLVLHNYRNCVLVSISHSFSCHTSVWLQNAMPVIRHWLVNTVCITIYILLYLDLDFYPPWQRGFLLATAEPLMGRPLGLTHQQYPV